MLALELVEDREGRTPATLLAQRAIYTQGIAGSSS
jgi:hypothetical protein